MAEAIAPLRARVQLQSPLRTPDELGGAVISWTDQGSVWAAIDAGGTGETAAQDGRVSTNALVAEIRTRADVRVGWRVLWGARTLRVLGVRDAGGPRIALVCEEEIR